MMSASVPPDDREIDIVRCPGCGHALAKRWPSGWSLVIVPGPVKTDERGRQIVTCPMCLREHRYHPRGAMRRVS